MKDYNDLLDFLQRSSDRFANQIRLSRLDMSRYSGDFWDEETRRTYRRGKGRLCATMNVWTSIANAITSKYSLSPWHIDIDPEYTIDWEGLQDQVDGIESRSNMKDSILETLRDAVVTGIGFMTMSTTDTGDILFEHVSDIGKVAFDPDSTDLNGVDATEGAVLDFVSKNKCKSLYGDEYLLHGREPRLATKFDQWTDYCDMVPVVHYFFLEDGVCWHRLFVNDLEYGEPVRCGRNIPIVRFTGNRILSDNQWDFEGLVRQTWNQMLGINIAYSTLLERCGRSTKANFIASVDAIDGLENYYARADREDSALVLYKGTTPPTQITESFQTQDLVNTINTCRQLIEDTVGIPLSGMASADNKTATEILQQETNRESNNLCYYSSAYTACRYIGTILLDILSGESPDFKLVNGPETITAGMRTRTELAYIAQYLPDNIKPILAKYACDTIHTPVADNIADNIVANLPVDLRFISDNKSDPEALHELAQMNALVEQMKAKIEELENENTELAKQNEALNISILDNREQRQLDWAKFKIQHGTDIATDTAKLNLEEKKQMHEAELDMARVQQDNTKIILEAAK